MPVAPIGEILNDPIARHMRRDFAHLREDQTVAEALALVRGEPLEGRVVYFYVLDEHGRLRGIVPTRRLLMSPPERRVAEIMVTDVIAIPERSTVGEACAFFAEHHLLAFPIVDEDRRVLGIVDVELYTSELGDIDRRERQDDLFQLIGVHIETAQIASPTIAFQRRYPWLLCSAASGIMAAFLAGLFEAELARVVALALFIPVVLALSESVSIQSVSLALHALHGQRPTLRAVLAKLRAEFLTGLLLGVALAGMVGLVALVWQRHERLALCLLGGITGGMVSSAVIGALLPNLFRLLRRDPRLAAGPVALAAADMVTLLIYFNLARWLLG